MGSYAALPDWYESDENEDGAAPGLGDLLSGRLAEVELDSVDAVRDEREPK